VAKKRAGIQAFSGSVLRSSKSLKYLAAFTAGFAAGVDLATDVVVFIAAEASAETSLLAAIITSAVSNWTFFATSAKGRKIFCGNLCLNRGKIGQ